MIRSVHDTWFSPFMIHDSLRSWYMIRSIHDTWPFLMMRMTVSVHVHHLFRSWAVALFLCHSCLFFDVNKIVVSKCLMCLWLRPWEPRFLLWVLSVALHLPSRLVKLPVICLVVSKKTSPPPVATGRAGRTHHRNNVCGMWWWFACS